MQPTNYQIYRITCPTGKIYIGKTGGPLLRRWYAHVAQANQTKVKRRPVSEAIHKYGKENFVVETMVDGLTKEQAAFVEHMYIMEYDATNTDKGYNILTADDTVDGPHHYFWRNIVKDPKAFEAYRQRLSEGARNGKQMHRIPELLAAAAEWKRNNPDKVKEAASRASQTRIANLMADPVRAEAILRNKAKVVIHRTDKETTFELNKRKTEKVWSERTEEQKAEIFDKISETLKEKNKRKSDEEKQQNANQLAEARKNVDRDLWAKRIAEGRKAYWTDERRAAKAEEVRKRYENARKNV